MSNVAILGSTGSIGRSTLDVIDASKGELSAVALSAHSNLDQLVAQAARVRPRWVVATDDERVDACDWSKLPSGTELLTGQEGLATVAADPEVDVVVTAIVGAAGLHSTWAAIEAGKRVALANKETLVMAGHLALALAEASGATIIPVDSEHSAVFQALAAGRRDEVRRVILTASGGPFRNLARSQLADVTVKDALDHPTWKMGKKITIDSATMMNKALEIIEARWLFDLDPDQIEVVIHPQSVVHSMVEYVDGSVIAQLSPPDMKLPIQYALSYPHRWKCPAALLDLTQSHTLEFEPPDTDKFPAIGLGLEVARSGGSAGAVLNAANESAVAGFINNQIRFDEIIPACRSVLENHNFVAHPTLERIIELDAWAREEVVRWVCA